MNGDSAGAVAVNCERLHIRAGLKARAPPNRHRFPRYNPAISCFRLHRSGLFVYHKKP